MAPSLRLLAALAAGLLLAACDRGGSAAPDEIVGACEGGELPPRQLRLLTRREYNNTVADLLGFAEDRACSVDADCQIEAESCVASRCQADPCNLHTFVLPGQGGAWELAHVAGSFNDWAPSVEQGGWAMRYLPERDLYVSKRVLDDGEYPYKFVLNGQHWVEDPANPRTTPDGFGGNNSVLTLRCEEGVPSQTALDFAAAFPVESRPEGFAYDNSAEAGLVTAVHVEQYLAAAEALTELALQQPEALLPCESGDASRACAEAFVTDFGSRAFRRPLSLEEVALYADLVTDQADFERGLEVLLRVMLSSPYFLYRFEMGQWVAGDRYVLSPYELAAALSYFFWASAPDDELLAAAGAGDLDSAEGVEQQARRLLADPRAREVLSLFALQWLGVERVADMDRSAALYPDFDEHLRASMLEETRRFVPHVVFDAEQSFDALLTAPYSLVDAELAQLYGLPAPEQDFSPVEGDGRRAGVLGQASVLASTAHSDQSSPIRRGLFVRQTLLCQSLGTPPPNAGGVPDVDPSASTRERFAQHTEDSSCQACHQHIDPLGFGFEHFDALGAWRDQDGGRPVDAAGQLSDVEGLGSGTSEPFHSLPELAALLARSDAAGACFTRQVYRFSLGRQDSAEQGCLLRDLQDQFEQSDRSVQELLIAMATSEAFRFRSPDAQ